MLSRRSRKVTSKYMTRNPVHEYHSCLKDLVLVLSVAAVQLMK
jgi:hypothetical protein